MARPRTTAPYSHLRSRRTFSRSCGRTFPRTTGFFSCSATHLSAREYPAGAQPRNFEMSEYLAAVLHEPQTVNPILNHLGIRVEHAQNGAATLRLDAGKCTAQGAGAVSGGVISTLLDEAMAHAVLSGQKELRPIATVDLHVQFLSGVRPDCVLICDAEVVKNGGRIAFVRAQASTPDGRLVATANASFIVKQGREKNPEG